MSLTSINRNIKAGADKLAVKVTFKDTISAAQYIKIDPLSCIPFTKIGDTTWYGLLRILSNFSGVGPSNPGPAAGIFSWRTNGAIVVSVDDNSLHLVRVWFVSQCISEKDIEMEVRSKLSWHEIIDGNYRHQAILLLRDMNAKWKIFCRMATDVKSSYLAERYRQLPKTQNMLHSPEFYVQFTLSEGPFNLSMEYNRLKLKEHRVTTAMVANSFIANGKYSSSSIKQTAQMAMRVPMAVIHAIK